MDRKLLSEIDTTISAVCQRIQSDDGCSGEYAERVKALAALIDAREKHVSTLNEIDERDLPHKILGLIFDDKPEGVSVGEIKSILNEAREIAESIQMVPEDD